MRFETSREVLAWYERQPRTLTPAFEASIPWEEVRQYPLDERFVPILTYMRDVEVLTDMYHAEMRRTPTGRDPVIRKFMERWGVEETTHGEIINRFLAEAGVVEPRADWKERVHGSVSRAYRVNAYLVTTLANLVGNRFTATHMTFGAIHEMSTGQAYRRLMSLAKHPVLDKILTGIMREESAHTRFYAAIAQLELSRSPSARAIARSIVNRFWRPVGEGSRPRSETENLIRTLFGEPDGVEYLDRNVSRKVQAFPGFDGLTKIRDTVAAIAGC